MTTREAWREWLDAHYQSEPEIWLVGYRKAAGQPNLPYNAAVEEALCFGWIDSIRKNLDDAALRPALLAAQAQTLPTRKPTRSG